MHKSCVQFNPGKILYATLLIIFRGFQDSMGRGGRGMNPFCDLFSGPSYSLILQTVDSSSITILHYEVFLHSESCDYKGCKRNEAQ